MNLFYMYSKMSVLSTFRNKQAFMFSIIFPLVLFLMFGHYDVKGHFAQIGSLTIFANYSVQTVLFLSLGMQISLRRSSDWTIYLRTLPAPSSASMIGLIIEKCISAFLSLTLIIIANIVISGMLISWPMIAYVMFAALLGGIPMAFLGVALGYKLNADSSRSVFVFSNLLLCSSYSSDTAQLIGPIASILLLIFSTL